MSSYFHDTFSLVPNSHPLRRVLSGVLCAQLDCNQALFWTFVFILGCRFFSLVLFPAPLLPDLMYQSRDLGIKMQKGSQLFPLSIRLELFHLTRGCFNSSFIAISRRVEMWFQGRVLMVKFCDTQLTWHLKFLLKELFS